MTFEQLPLIMLRALVLTVMIECAAGWLLGVRHRSEQLVIVLANLITNPIVVSGEAAVIFLAGWKALLPAAIVLELMALIAETAIYRKHIGKKPDPLLLSLTCNTVSLLIGEVLNRFVF